MPEPIPGKPQTVLGLPQIVGSELSSDVTIDRLNSRRTLLQQIDGQLRRLESTGAIDKFSRRQRQAFDILMGSGLRTAFQLDDEDANVVDRYGHLP